MFFRGQKGPDKDIVGNYNSRFWETEFFRDGGTWCTEYGHFFLGWYSNLLVRHADAVLSRIRSQLKETCSGVVLNAVEQVHSVLRTTLLYICCVLKKGPCMFVVALFGFRNRTDTLFARLYHGCYD
jgi:hypothetical protein